MAARTRSCIVLASGRGGCDAQMRAVASRLGLDVVPDMAAAGTTALCVATTGPERSDEALLLGSMMGIPVVGFGQPGYAARSFDLVLTTPQFDVRGGNVVRLERAISPHGDCAAGLHGPDAETLRRLPGPLGLVLVGGAAGPWGLDGARLVALIGSLSARSGSVLVLTSSRTPCAVKRALFSIGRGNIMVDRVHGQAIRMTAAIRACSEAHVTGDSVSMISEATAASRATAVIVPQACAMEVEAYLREAREDPRRHAMPGDLRRFWSTLGGDLGKARLRPADVCPLDAAAAAVAGLLARRIGEAVAA